MKKRLTCSDRGEYLVLKGATPDLPAYMPAMILVKVPRTMYQVFYDMALTNHNKDYVRRCILRDLKEWINDKYPGYGIIHFEDYSSAEALQVTERTGINIEWGMYLVLEYGATMQPYQPESTFLEIYKTLTHGTEQP